VLLFVLSMLSLSACLLYQRTMFRFEQTNPMETLYATSVIMTLSLAVFVSVQVKQRPLSGYRSLEEGSDQFANDDIMELLYIKPKYRPIFLVSLVTGAAGLALLMLGISRWL